MVALEMFNDRSAASFADFERDICVWTAALDCAPEVLIQLESILSSDESSRANKFVFSQDRSRFVAARGILRKLLGAYLNKHPATLNFIYGLHGKPSIQAPDQSSANVQFNLSHSHGIAVCGVARNRHLGIDVELLRAGFNCEEIAERYFSAQELEALRVLPIEKRTEGFFNCWTRKEAYLKALGKGLQYPLDGFDVTLAPHTPARFLKGVDAGWHLTSFAPAKDYTAAIVYDGPASQIRYFGLITGTSIIDTVLAPI